MTDCGHGGLKVGLGRGLDEEVLTKRKNMCMHYRFARANPTPSHNWPGPVGIAPRPPATGGPPPMAPARACLLPSQPPQHPSAARQAGLTNQDPNNQTPEVEKQNIRIRGRVELQSQRLQQWLVMNKSADETARDSYYHSHTTSG